MFETLPGPPPEQDQYNDVDESAMTFLSQGRPEITELLAAVHLESTSQGGQLTIKVVGEKSKDEIQRATQQKVEEMTAAMMVGPKHVACPLYE